MYFDEVESDNMFFEVCIAVLLLYDSIGASQILKNVGRNVGERFLRFTAQPRILQVRKII